MRHVRGTIASVTSGNPKYSFPNTRACALAYTHKHTYTLRHILRRNDKEERRKRLVGKRKNNRNYRDVEFIKVVRRCVRRKEIWRYFECFYFVKTRFILNSHNFTIPICILSLSIILQAATTDISSGIQTFYKTQCYHHCIVLVFLYFPCNVIGTWLSL